MSNDVFSLVKKRVIGSATMKAVMLLMADSASDDGSGVWISKANLARDLELSKRAVQLAVQSFEDRGLLVAVGQKACRNGFTVEYQINLSAVEALPSTRESRSPVTGESDSPVNPIHPYPCTRFTPTRESHSPKPSLEPSLEPPIAREQLTLLSEDPEPTKKDRFSDFWRVYPKKAGKPAAQRAFDKAVKAGIDPQAIIDGAKRYARWLNEAGPGEFRPHAKHPQGWITDERWTDSDLPPLPSSAPFVPRFKADFEEIHR